MSEESLFHAALAIADPAERSAYLYAACRGDDVLRRRLEDLLRAHGGSGPFLEPLAWADATRSFDGSGGSLATLAASVGGLPRILLRDTDGGVEPPLIRPGGAGGDGASLRYRIDGEIARGGMGAVFKGRDPDLGREVAVKVLREDLRDNYDLVRRFIEEAQIGGQLQHPGVVPIYELGIMGDHRPFFAMKLVKGRTLAALLADRAGPASELPRFVGIVEAIAQTVAYAHARGVIHRDLKPSNVMIGGFGEVQVMDWGLAKVLARGGAADDAGAGRVDGEAGETRITTARSGSGPDLSHAGSVLGTPSYMAPEQARGEVGRVDERADVFALGSILCEVLTGEPAFTGRSSSEIHRKAEAGDTANALARLAACVAPPELVGLARDCLAAEPRSRPHDAGAVSARVTAYLAGVQERVRAAERERAVAEAKAVEERKRRRLAVALAASIVATMALGGTGGAYLLQQRQARLAEADRRLGEVSALLTHAKSRPEDPAGWHAAAAAAGLVDRAGLPAGALARLDGLAREARAGADAAEADRDLLAQLVDIRSAEADDRDGSASDAAYADAFRQAGYDVDGAGPAAAGAAIRSRPAPVALELAAALDDWASQRRKARPADADAWRRPLAAARAVDPDPRRGELRAIWERDDRKAQLGPLRDLATRAEVATWPAQTANLLGTALDKAGDPDAAAVLLRRAVGRHPDDVWTNYNLARALARARPPRRDEAIRYYTAARALRPELAHVLAHTLADRGETAEAIALFRDLDRLRPGNGGHLLCLGEALQSVGRVDEAGAAFDGAVDALRAAIGRRPSTADYISLGHALVSQRKVGESEAAYREGVRLEPDNAAAHRDLGALLCDQRRAFAAAEAELREALRLEPDDAEAHRLLGVALTGQGKHAAAEAAYREAIRLKPDYAAAHNGLGAFLCDVKREYAAAEAELREAIRLKPDATRSHVNLGIALRNQGKHAAAEAAYREAIRLNPDYAEAHGNLGALLSGVKREYAAAEAELREAIRLKPDYTEAHGNLGSLLGSVKRDYAAAEAEFREVIRLRPDDTTSRTNLGHALTIQGKHAAAEAAYREAIRLKPDSAEAHGDLGNFLSDVKRDYTAAEAELRDAIRLKPDLAEAHANLGVALLRRRKPAEAEAELREAIRLKPDYALAHRNLGALLSSVKRDYAAAEAAYREAIRLGPDDAAGRYNLGCVLTNQGKSAEAVATYREVIRLKPDYAEAHCNLGRLLRQAGGYAEALEELRHGHELGSRRPDWPYPSAAWVRDAERLASLAERLPAFLKGDDRPRDAAERLALAEVCHGTRHYVAAVRFRGEALEADPKLGDGRGALHRYNAACAAALAAAGKGKDDPPPDEAARGKLRGQALGWLRAERDAWAKLLDAGDPGLRPAVVQFLRRWQSEADLAGVRDAEALAKLPEAERKDWQALWADVDALLKRAGLDPRFDVKLP